LVEWRGVVFKRNIRYKNIIIPGDAAGSIAKVYALQGSFFRECPSSITPVLHEKNRTVVKITIAAIDIEIGEPEAFAHQFLGMLERMLEKVGVKSYRSEVRTVDNGYELELTWE
jgi:hypothetical protein